MGATLFDWASQISIALLGECLLVAALGVGFLCHRLRLYRDRYKSPADTSGSDNQENYIVSGVLVLVALVMSFTLVVAVNRFDTRRVLVLQEANAIKTAYLRSRLLAEPRRERLSKLLVAYTNNRIALATVKPENIPKLLSDNDRMLTELWSAAAAAFDSISSLDFSTTFVEGINGVIELDASRKAARMANVPSAIVVLLTICVIVTAGVLGYVLKGMRHQLGGGLLISLLTLVLTLIVDLERPTSGNIQESQLPLEMLRAFLMEQPPEIFDRWRTLPR